MATALELPPSSSTDGVTSSTLSLLVSSPREFLIRGFSERMLFKALSRFLLYMGECRVCVTSTVPRGICCDGRVSKDFIVGGGIVSGVGISFNLRRLLRVL